MKTIEIVLVALVIATFLVGAVSAAQTSFSVAVVDGTVRTHASQITMTYGDLPYDKEQYKRDVFAVYADQFTMTSSLDSDGGVEVLTTINYMPKSNLQLIFVDEELKKARVAEGENESVCYDASAKTRITARGLGYESASIIDSSNVAFAANSVGLGKFSMQTRERIVVGDVNGTFTESVVEDSFKVQSGMWNGSMQYTSMISDYPALSDRSDSLCAFHKIKP